MSLWQKLSILVSVVLISLLLALSVSADEISVPRITFTPDFAGNPSGSQVTSDYPRGPLGMEAWVNTHTSAPAAVKYLAWVSDPAYPYVYRFYMVTQSVHKYDGRTPRYQNDFPMEYIIVFRSNKPLRLVRIPSDWSVALNSAGCCMIVAPEGTSAGVYAIGGNYSGGCFDAGGQVYNGVGWAGTLGTNKFLLPPNPLDVSDTDYPYNYDLLKWTALAEVGSPSAARTAFVPAYAVQFAGSRLNVYGNGLGNTDFEGTAAVSDVDFEAVAAAQVPADPNANGKYFGLDQNKVEGAVNPKLELLFNALRDESIARPDSVQLTVFGKSYTLLDPAQIDPVLPTVRAMVLIMWSIAVFWLGYKVVSSAFGFALPLFEEEQKGSS